MKFYNIFNFFLLLVSITTTSFPMQTTHEKTKLSDFALSTTLTRSQIEKVTEKSTSMTEKYLTSRHDLLFDNAFGYTHQEIPDIVALISHRYQMQRLPIPSMTREEKIRLHHIYHIIHPDCCDSCCK